MPQTNTDKGDVALGLDLGATALKAGLVAADGECLALPPRDTQSDRGPVRVLENLKRAVDDGLAAARERGWRVVGIGVGTPGGVRQPEGTVLAGAENIPGWDGTVVGHPLSDHAGGLVTVVDNDANAALLAEWTFGRACGDAHAIVGLTLGTGVGGAVIVGGKLERGDGFVGEFGHVGIDVDGPVCRCGGRGCLELYASIRGVEGLARRRIEAGARAEWLRATGPALVPAALDAARNGQQDAERLWEDYGAVLGYGISTLAVTLQPQVIVLFGGIAHAFPFFAAGMRRTLVERTRYGEPPHVCVTTLGYQAGVQGAAALAWAAHSEARSG